ncbi:hypothetical protein ACFVVU_11005 [Kitasatospora sp. NPDC057965]|uniref:hypothetical protein n=1 Tax=Kitasatospora sp. NPDC057965 TaxID=3346291 RepID=UPI0036DC21C8
MTELPLLLLDVDGPLNPYAAVPQEQPAGYRTHHLRPDFRLNRFPGRPAEEVEPLRLWLNPGHGPELLGLPFELVWATAWQHEANSLIAPLVGLPELPYVPWPRIDQEEPDGLHWKTRVLVEWAAGRPFVWVDDELGPQDTEWIAAHHPGPAATFRIDPRIGLRAEDFATLRGWARAEVGAGA